VEELTLESLRKKPAVKGLERDAILQLEGQVYDAELKIRQEADAELLETMKKAHERQLQLLEEERNPPKPCPWSSNPAPCSRPD
jgi:hypothetical protein